VDKDKDKVAEGGELVGEGGFGNKQSREKENSKNPGKKNGISQNPTRLEEP